MTISIPSLLNQVQHAYSSQEYRLCHQLCMQVLELQGDCATAYYFLALIAVELGNIERGKELLLLAIKYDPQKLQFRIKLIEALFANGYLAQAHYVSIQAMNCMDTSQDSLNALGTFLNRLDCHKEAEHVYTKAENLVDNINPSLLFNISTTYKFMGNITKARAYINRAIDAGHYSNSYIPLAELTPDDDLTELENTLLIKLNEYHEKGFNKVNPESTSNVLFALALCFDRQGKYDKSFEYLVQANQIKRKAIAYDSSVDSTLMKTLKQRFNTVKTQDVPENSNNIQLIFIVGMPRTGSTLLERILSSHKDVKSAGEIQSMPIEFRRLCKLSSNKLLDEEVVLASHSIDFAELAKRYKEEISRFKGKEQFIIDKLPYNFLYIGAIKSAFPHAKIIHIKRNPIDTCLSNYKQSYANAYPYSYDLIELAKYYVNYNDLMKHWQRIYPQQIFELSYESLVNNTELETRRLLSYCNLPWQQNCLTPHKNNKQVSTASSLQVRRPIYSDSLLRWKKYAKHLAAVTTIVEDANIKIT